MRHVAYVRFVSSGRGGAVPKETAIIIARLLSLDLWGTLLLRRCHPAEIGSYPLRHLLARHGDELRPEVRSVRQLQFERSVSQESVGRRNRLAARAEDYELGDVFVDLLCRVWQGRIPDQQLRDVAGTLVALERQQLVRQSLLNEAILCEVRQYRYESLVLISDFYLPARDVGQILSALCAGVAFAHIFVSCEQGGTKRSGRLYRRVHAALGVTPEEHVHIGDDYWADYLSARRLGIRAVLHEAPIRPAQQRSSRAYVTGMLRPADYLVDLKADLATIRPLDPSRAGPSALFDVGKALAPLLCSFVFWLNLDALRAGSRRIFYLTREGEFFLRIHRRLTPGQLFGIDVPEGNLLQVSRRSTFAAAVSEPSLESFLPHFHRYGLPTIRSLLVHSVGLDDLTAAELEATAGAMSVRGRLSLAHWRSFLQHPTVRERLRGHCLGKRAALEQYLRTHGIGDTTESCTVVDLAGHGTIQDHLAAVVPGCPWTGYYLHCRPSQPRHAESSTCRNEKRSFLHGEPLRIPALFLEQVCGTNYGTAVGYENGEVRTEASPPAVQAQYDRHYRFVQDGVLAAAPAVFDWLSRHAIPSDLLPALGVEMTSPVVDRPPHILAEAFLDAILEDEFLGATGHHIDAAGGAGFGWVTAFAALFVPAVRRRIFRALGQSQWPQARLAAEKRGALLWYYNRHVNARQSP